MKKLFLLFGIVIAVLILFIAGFYLYSTYISKTPASSSSLLSFLKKDKTPQVQLITQAKGDKEGRTATFTVNNQPSKSHSSVGVVYGTNMTTIRYIVGAFAAWEPISGSVDRFIILYDPTTGQYLPRVRVLFSGNFLVNTDVPIKEATMIEIVDLNKADQPFASATQPYKTIDIVSEQDLNKILQVGDVVTIRPYFSSPEVVHLDENGNVLAASLYLRRFDGIANL